MTNSHPAGETAIRIGCAGLPQGLKRQRHFEQLGLLETTDTFFSLPRPSILRRWRRDASETRPQGAAFSLVALGGITDPQGAVRAPEPATESAAADTRAGHFQDTPLVRSTTDTVAAAAAALEAEVVLFRSPVDFTPTRANRDAMQHYFEEIGTAEVFGGAARAWEPQGIWDPAEAVELCGELGLVYALDPLSQDPTTPDLDPVDLLPPGVAYFRVTGLGGPRRALDAYALESLLAQMSRFERCWLVFATLDKRRDAIACQKLLVSLAQ